MKDADLSPWSENKISVLTYKVKIILNKAYFDFQYSINKKRSR